MNKRPNPELIDEDNPEWTSADTHTAVVFIGLPPTLQAKLRSKPEASNRPNPYLQE